MNRKLNRLLFGFLLLAVPSTYSQNKDDPYSVGVYFVKSEYIGDLGNRVFNFAKDLNFGGAVSLDRYISRFFDAGLYVSLSQFGFNNGVSQYSDWEGIQNRDENPLRNFATTSFFNANAHFRFKIWGNSNWRVFPYLGLGVGISTFNNITGEYLDGNNERQVFNNQVNKDAKWNVCAFTGLGMVGAEWRIASWVSLRYQVNIAWTGSDKADFFVKGGNDWHLQHNLGFAFNFSIKDKDSDGDGVVNRFDKCPGTPIDTPVDKKGCPIIRQDVEPEVEPIPDIIIPKEQELSYTITPVTFPLNKADLSGDIQLFLDSIANILHSDSSLNITVIGHTDNTGTDAFNEILSNDRAKEVVKALIARGIDNSRLTFTGKGSSSPVASNDTLAGRAQNRRVEFIISKITH
jgi:outer membrane protein OmpA-like peptidoglycan-associated protein